MPPFYLKSIVLFQTSVVHSCLILNNSQFQNKKNCCKNSQNLILEQITSVDLFVSVNECP